MSDFEELLSKLLEKIPELSRSVIEEKINEKKDRIGSGYLTDEGALFLIAWLIANLITVLNLILISVIRLS